MMLNLASTMRIQHWGANVKFWRYFHSDVLHLDYVDSIHNLDLTQTMEHLEPHVFC